MMERDEMIRYIEFLQDRLDEEKRARELSDKRFEEESTARKEADKRVFELLDQINRMGVQHSREMQSLLQKNQELHHSIEDLTSVLRLDRKNTFCSKSQKSRPASDDNRHEIEK